VPNPDLPRGAVITVAGSNSEFGSKPRPAILLQSTALLDAARPLPICPITSQASDAPLFRIQLPSDAETGLLEVHVQLVCAVGVCLRQARR